MGKKQLKSGSEKSKDQRPKVVEQLFSGFSAIDVHDHYRQGSLAFETHWQTRTWWHRVFGSLLGMIMTDAFLLYRKQHTLYSPPEMDAKCEDYRTFLGRLAHQLIFPELIK
jgi:hypothetical protein